MFAFETFKFFLKKPQKVLLISILLLNLASTLVWAQTSDTEEKKTEAYWQKQIELDPAKPLNYFNLGVLNQQNKKYSEAIINYDKAIELKSPLTPVALYYKARALESLKKIAEAQKVLSQINMQQVPPALKTKVLEYKNRLFAAEVATDSDSVLTNEVQSEEKTLSLYVEVARGQNSNPDIYSETQTASIQKDYQNQARLGFDYLAWYSSVHDLKLDYYYSSTQFDKATSSNYSSHDVLIPLAFYFGHSRLKLTPEYIQDTYSGSIFSESKGAELMYTLKLKDDYINLGLQNMQIDNKTSSYSYLSGSMQKATFSYENRWAHSKLVTTLYGSQYKYQDTSTLGSSYSAYGLSFSYSYYINSVDFALGFAGEGRQYKKATNVTDTRNDLKTNASAQMGYTFLKNFRVFIDGSYVKNKSNFNTSTDDHNYQQSVYSLGLNWAY